MSGRTLVVASAGGHLQQALTLLPRLPVEPDPLFVTYDVAQTRSLLAGKEVVHAFHPTTKHLPNAVRNYRLARQVFAQATIGRVISTGAAVAVPFVIRGRQLRIPCHYLESATRVVGPSLTGRMLERVPGVRRYRQLGEWGGDRWQQGPCVFDGFQVAEGNGEARLRRVVVSLGTHGYHFDRLVRALVAILPADVEVLWQLGATPDPGGLPGTVVEHLPSDRLQAALAEADAVVGHAGVGLTLTALRVGKVPVLVPRRAGRREHTDDHQVELAGELQRRGLAVTADAGDLRRDHLERAASLVATERAAAPFDLRD